VHAIAPRMAQCDRKAGIMTQKATTDNTSLEKLKDSGLELADPSQDIRDRKIVDSNGVEIGHVSGLFIDERERKIRMLEIRVGDFLGIGGQHVLCPVDAITTVTKDQVTINQTRERLVHSPAYDPEIITAPRNEDFFPYYGYYGFSPFWNAGYQNPLYETRP
jgi:sporulation protein YlmC with PRC-barrel domain